MRAANNSHATNSSKQDIANPRRELEDLAHGVNPVHIGHGDIHDDDIGFELARLRNRIAPVVGLGNNLDAMRFLQQAFQTGAKNIVIIRENYPDRHKFLL